MKKTTALLLTLLILLTAASAVCFFMRPELVFTEEHAVLERGMTYSAEEQILQSKGEVSAEKENLCTDEVGEYEVHYTVKRWLFEKEYVLAYKVEDTTPPKIEIREMTVYKDPDEDYSQEEMQENVTVDEGSLSFETDYDGRQAGVYRVNITADDGYGNISEAFYEVVVKDNSAPFVFRNGKGSKILRGSEFNINNIISYGDNADPKPECIVEGEVDTSVVGNYPLHVLLRDLSGNSREWDLSVEVVEEIPQEEARTIPYAFPDFKERYAQSGRKLGIDVSFWQGDVDYEAVRDAGCDFVILRIGYSYKGELTLDRKYEQNIERIQKAGIPVGIYLFCYDNNDEDLLSSLDMVFEKLEGVDVALPVAFDWENFGKYQNYELSFQQLNHLYDVFEKEVTKRGYQSILYGSKYYLQNIWNDTDIRPIWLAQYSGWPTYDGPYQFWQLSESGTIDGIQGYVDLDIWFTEE